MKTTVVLNPFAGVTRTYRFTLENRPTEIVILLHSYRQEIGDVGGFFWARSAPACLNSILYADIPQIGKALEEAVAQFKAAMRPAL